MTFEPHPDEPGYADYVRMGVTSAAHGAAAARQVVATTRQHLSAPLAQLDVLDLGSGYGDTAAELHRSARSVHAVEPSRKLHEAAVERYGQRTGLTFELGGVSDLGGNERFDVVVLDNVYEHLPDQPAALSTLDRVLRPGGVVYLLMPNRLWPIEAHYRLPFLAWLPLPLATAYLRLSRRGIDYTDASYARSSWTLARHLDRTGWDWSFVLPGDPAATRSGLPWHYRLGMKVLKRIPALWCVSKSLLVVAVKPSVESRASTSDR